MVFIILYAIYVVFALPALDLYIDSETGYFSNIGIPQFMWRSFLLLLPGVALIMAYKVYKESK